MTSEPRKIALYASLGLSSLVLVLGVFGSNTLQWQRLAALTNPDPAGHRPKKNPKLSAQIADLARIVPQRTTPLALGEELTTPAGFSVARLPKSARDAMKAGQMKINDKGEVQVYIQVNEITDANLERLKALGVTVQILGQPKPDKTKGEVLSAVPTVQSFLPIAMINQAAALSFVRYIRLPDYGFTHTGSVDTQGDGILKADSVRQQFGVGGTGVRVGVISGGIGGIFATGCTTCGPTTATPSPINSGDLPNAIGTRNGSGVLTSVSGGIIAQSFRADGDLEDAAQPDGPAGVNAEGTAMLEIVHDLAPAARLFFANGDTSLAFEQAVNFLASMADVVVDDLGWFTPPFDGTSAVSTNTATALNTDANPIRGYFTAVGNFARNHYSEAYVDSGTDAATAFGLANSGDLHLFQTSSLANTTPSDANQILLLQTGTVSIFVVLPTKTGQPT